MFQYLDQEPILPWVGLNNVRRMSFENCVGLNHVRRVSFESMAEIQISPLYVGEKEHSRYINGSLSYPQSQFNITFSFFPAFSPLLRSLT